MFQKLVAPFALAIALTCGPALAREAEPAESDTPAASDSAVDQLDNPELVTLTTGLPAISSGSVNLVTSPVR
ncbi:MAG: hypothetical protein DWQ31_07110 [Planctomycetota bacterium]|nr:MAG: hypothetical protein DWQ31_07110 [Planctomycetota bacterium]REJ89563.1 MAG: hypothetical protein DWQ35_17905 [Planctomycetota bacterium]REK31426.1 MAG: hypothetical protein DWQ42_00415 [Planctomycetota bacterium]REK40656.1 MAG: hypothetical protein DWQ46_15555 [Planctomycetota bacterium]